MKNTMFQTRHLPPDIQELVDTIISTALALASRMNSNRDSNSLGGILIYPAVDNRAIKELSENRTSPSDVVS